MKTTMAIACVAGLAMSGAALADWNPGDPYKMHYPQLPDPTGIDVNMTAARLADDFRCTQSGPITDIHFWWSVRGDREGISQNAITSVTAQIYSDVPGGIPGTPGFSQPGQLLWQRTFSSTQPNVKSRVYSQGTQSFWDPPFTPNTFTPADHFFTYQTNITEIGDAFVQTAGTIYWLSLQVTTASDNYVVGWKTSGSDQFNDTHVYQGAAGGWSPNYDPRLPTAPVKLDLAFVITPTPGTAGVLGLGLIGAARRRR